MLDIKILIQTFKIMVMKIGYDGKKEEYLNMQSSIEKINLIE